MWQCLSMQIKQLVLFIFLNKIIVTFLSRNNQHLNKPKKPYVMPCLLCCIVGLFRGKLRFYYGQNTCSNNARGIFNQRTDSTESRLVGNGLEVFTLFCSNLLKAFKIQNNLTIQQYYMQSYF